MSKKRKPKRTQGELELKGRQVGGCQLLCRKGKDVAQYISGNFQEKEVLEGIVEDARRSMGGSIKLITRLAYLE